MVAVIAQLTLCARSVLPAWLCSCKGKNHMLVHDVVGKTPKGKEIKWELITPPKPAAAPAAAKK